MIRTTQSAADSTAASQARGRKKINYEQMPARFPEGTFARLDAVLKPAETRTDLIRDAVDAVIVSRERIAERKAAAEAVKREREQQRLREERRAKRAASKARKASTAVEAAE